MPVLLKNLPREDLPRERLIRGGVSSLSNEELVAILLRTGTEGISAKELASEIISSVKDIGDLKYISLSMLSKHRGMGIAKSTNLIAALELGKRVYSEGSIKEKVKISNAIDCYRYFAKEIMYESQEHFMAIFLDNQQRYISHKIIFKGTINMSIVSPREVFKLALEEDANKIILMHNHPSGVLNPSKADDILTETIVKSGAMMDIKVLDHVIVGQNDYYSYVEEGRLVYER